jgi:hypothetical protein
VDSLAAGKIAGRGRFGYMADALPPRRDRLLEAAGAQGPANATLPVQQLATLGRAHAGAEALFPCFLDSADLTRVMHGYLLAAYPVSSSF